MKDSVTVRHFQSQHVTECHVNGQRVTVWRTSVSYRAVCGNIYSTLSPDFRSRQAHWSYAPAVNRSSDQVYRILRLGRQRTEEILLPVQELKHLFAVDQFHLYGCSLCLLRQSDYCYQAVQVT
ncbi:hypothetical protein MPTK1_7g02460 [Marchantia polymorpha subsp. ruderalis]|uniref:Uncharacterized protein n=2 Tax=Marchantia polymorpha TaxID=3197 RepID=A0AAF6BVE2_MARPO|nr:hypothetical protein MARPO_0088s0040 [Marchantia polymorpha]BBN15976.1 hypothetical protein Mp_7g02460 [Marchantia polymorpha subsp. ruderalis]|eukprot:PTQ33494.1 hypothetical protein MARPO_0088s0040 [Marchantia polymorpha]